MLDEHNDNERVLREHIHGILYEYAYTHLTTDYDQFTRDAVFEVSALLQPFSWQLTRPAVIGFTRSYSCPRQECDTTPA